MGWFALDVPVPLFGQLVEGGVPVDGIGIREVFLEGGEGASAGEDEGRDGGHFIGGGFFVGEIVGQAMQDDADEDGFLGEINAFGFGEEGRDFFSLHSALVVAVGGGVCVAF